MSNTLTNTNIPISTSGSGGVYVGGTTIANPSYTSTISYPTNVGSISGMWNNNCHGCVGKGWVETSDRTPHKCPVCSGSGKYNQMGFSPIPYVPYIPMQPWTPIAPIYPQYPTPFITSSDYTTLTNFTLTT